MDSLSTRVNALLARRPGLKPAGLARIASVSTATVSDWRNNVTKSMKPEPARRLSIEFGCDQNWLMTGIGTPDWRDPNATAATAAPASNPPTIRQALVAIRAQLLATPASRGEAIGDALRLMATVPDSDRAFEQALTLLSSPGQPS